jgi:hypothetical protein
VLLADRRVELDPRPAPPPAAPLDAVLVGHCPGPPEGGAAQWRHVARDAAQRSALEALGLGHAARRLARLAETPPPVAEEGDPELRELYGLPLRVHSLGQFRALFPHAFVAPTARRGGLGGERAWLPLAVQDFFEGSTSLDADALTLWVVRVPEEGEEAAFLPGVAGARGDPARLGAFERALRVPRAGILALPDLERLLLPPGAPRPPRMRLPNEPPAFLPCGRERDDTHRERRHADEMPGPAPRVDPLEAACAIAGALARTRPDVVCLLAVPLEAEAGRRPRPSRAFLDGVAALTRAAGPRAGEPRAGEAAESLRHLQLLYPYLRGPGRPLGSPSGLVAGVQALVARRHGPWRSIGERPLPGASLPWPPVPQHEATALREAPGVTVLVRRGDRAVVDDERLCAPCLPLAALAALPPRRRAEEHWRSAEVLRFMGWIRRELQALGERLLFASDPHDPRPELALRAFFTGLHARGALRGARPEDAFRLERRAAAPEVIAWDVELAPSYPLDRVRLSFLQDRDASAVRTALEVADG